MCEDFKERTMTAIWIYLAFSLGVMLGFCLFAVLTIAKEEQRGTSAALSRWYRNANRPAARHKA